MLPAVYLCDNSHALLGPYNSVISVMDFHKVYPRVNNEMFFLRLQLIQ